MTTTAAESHSQASEDYQAALGWAVQHEPTQRAYALSTGEHIAPALARFRLWVETNLIGGEDAPSESEPATDDSSRINFERAG